MSIAVNLLSRFRAAPSVVLCLCVTCFTASLASAQFVEIIAFESPGNTTYYLDAESGSDENTGTRKESAWKTLRRVNTTRFAPGDRLLVKAGTAYHGRLWPKGSGTRGGPIIIDRFGEGPRPAIHAEGESSEALLLDNQRSWHIKNLELTNTGDEPEMFRYGINILADNFDNAGDIKLINLFVHDVNGTTKRGIGRGAGIIWRNQGAITPTRFDGILVEGCTIKDCARDGIAGENSLADRRGWTPNLNVVIRENEIENIQGDGIRLTGSENAIIEYNKVISAGLAEDGHAGGINVTSSDNTLVQYNVISHTQGKTNAAMRCGSNSHDNTFQFNYTFDNAGPLAVIETEPSTGEAFPSRFPNAGTAVRYNISQNDGGAFRITGPVHGTRLHNNTVYSPPGSHTVTIALSDRSGPPTDTTLANNLFYVQGQAAIDFDPAVKENETHYLSNAYFGPQPLPEAETDPVTADPRLKDPGTGQDMRNGLEGYQTIEGSPLRNAGTRIHKHGGHDFWDNPVPGGKKVDIGAYQAPSDKPAPSAQPDSNP